MVARVVKTAFGVFVLVAGWAPMPRGNAHAAEGPVAAGPPAQMAGFSPDSVESLAARMMERNKSERDRARGAFRWIASNVRYDASLRGEKADAEAVIKEKRAVCQGYGALFNALAEAMGLEAKVIRGHGKGWGYHPGGAMENAQSHSWNVVKVDGKWQLVDCTWGAGYLSDEGRFMRKFEEHYFLTPPEQFVYDHFPEDAQWQLLEKPLSKEEYIGLPRVKPAFFKCGLKPVSHQAPRVEADGSLRMVFEAPEEIVVTAGVVREGKMLEYKHTFVQREPEGFTVYAQFPSEGDYVLRIHACRKEALRQRCDDALEYAVRARSGGEAGGGYPRQYAAFLERDCRLESPLTCVLGANSLMELRLEAPGATEVIVESDGMKSHLVSKTGSFSGRAIVKERGVRVLAKFGEQITYDTLLGYEVK